VRSLEILPAEGTALRLTADSTQLVLVADGGSEVRLRRIPGPWIRKLRSALRSFPPDDAGDVAANVTMTVPLGFFFVLWRRRGRPGRTLIALVVLQAAVTVVAETIQMVSLYRQPDVTDLVSNLAGALVGTGLARAVLQKTE
jgi:VanZ family protein